MNIILKELAMNFNITGMIKFFFKEPKKNWEKNTHIYTDTYSVSTKFLSIDFHEYEMTNNSKSHVFERNERDVNSTFDRLGAFFFLMAVILSDLKH